MKASEIISQIEENKKNLEFLPTGFSGLDTYLDGGFMKKELIVIGGHTGIGKSYFGMQILYTIATQGFKCAYFSLEISNQMILSRLIGSLSNIKPTRIYAGLLEAEEFDKKAQAKANITMYDQLMDFHDEIYAYDEIVKELTKNSYDFVVIDFIQNVIVPNKDEYTRLSELSLMLQRLAKKLNCCILLLSQLSNRVAKDGSKVIEYKGSGSIAMVADLGFFIERAEVSVNGRQEVRLNLRKNRRGASGQLFAFEFIHPGGLLKQI